MSNLNPMEAVIKDAAERMKRGCETAPEFFGRVRAEEKEMALEADDPVEHPSHYTSHPSGVECIQITEHLNFCLGNAVKYLWRAGLKQDAIEDLKKARWYVDREIARLEESQS